MVVTALPFAFVVLGVMWAWARDLRNDPYMIRRRYAKAAIAEGIRAGIAEHGDDFIFGASETDAEHGAGAWLDSKDPALTDWYTDVTTGAIPIVNSEQDQPNVPRSATNNASQIEDADRQQ